MFRSEHEYNDLGYITKLKTAAGLTQHEDILNKTLTSDIGEAFDPSSLRNKIEKQFAKSNKTKKEESISDFTRIVVYARKDTLSMFSPVDFFVCLFDYFGTDPKRPFNVECFIENDKVFIQPQDDTKRQQDGAVRKSRKNVYRLEVSYASQQMSTTILEAFIFFKKK